MHSIRLGAESLAVRLQLRKHKILVLISLVRQLNIEWIVLLGIIKV